MKRFLVLTLALLTIATLILGLRWRNRGAFTKVRASSREAPANDHDPLSGLDRRAKEAKSGDPESIRALADEIFTSTLPEREAQNPLVEAVKYRLVRAQLDYNDRGKQQQSIDESHVVRTVNQAADLLHLPDYAKTTGLQVRMLRLSLLLHLPHFIAQEDFSDRSIANPQRHAKIGKKVSPLEAAYLVLALVQQKRNNAAFQVTPKEFRESVYARNVARWKEHRDSKGVDSSERPTLHQQVKSAKAEEIERTAAYQMGQQPVSDLLTIPAKLMDTLLTSRKEAKQ